MNIFEISLSIITGVGVIITAFILPLTRKYLIPFFQLKLNKTQFDTLIYWVEIAIRYYEVNIQQVKSGAFKKAEVLKFIADKGYKISEEELNMLIDALVARLNKIEWT